MVSISVTITSYNQKKYLIEAIESVLGQTVLPSEIIIADDCSIDGSQEVIRAYERQHPTLIKGIYNPNNLGISENRNSALRICNSDYVAILDGDDRYLRENLQSHLSSIENDPDYGCAYSNVRFIDHLGDAFGIRDKNDMPDGSVFPVLATGKFGWLRSMIIRRDLLQEVGYLDEDFPKHDGFILCLRLATRTMFRYIPTPLTEYRVHPLGDSKSFDHSARINYLLAVKDEVLNVSSTQRLTSRQLSTIHNAWSFRIHALSARYEWTKKSYIRSIKYLLLAISAKLGLQS